MTKKEILDEFNDINFAYNDSSKYETLSRMLDELLKEQTPPKETFWDSMSEVELMEPMRHFKD